MNGHVSRVSLLAFAVALVIGPVAAGAQSPVAPNARLYETVESMTLGGSGNVIRKATAALTGWLKAGSPICPTSLDVEFCTLNVMAFESVRIDTGKGTVTGDFSVVVPCPPFCNAGDNPIDAPEITVLSGTLRADIDLGPAYLQGIPIAHLTGSLQGIGTNRGPLFRVVFRATFTGTFRLPFVFPDVPKFPPSYVIDPDRWPAAGSYRDVLFPDEYLFSGDRVPSYPMVLLELMIK